MQDLHHCCSELDSRQGLFQLFRLSQGVVQKRPEIGLDDFEFTSRYRDLLRKIVENAGDGAPSPSRTNRPRQLRFPTTLSVGTVSQTRSALKLSPGWAGLTRPDARIDPGIRAPDGEPDFDLIAPSRLRDFWPAR